MQKMHQILVHSVGDFHSQTGLEMRLLANILAADRSRAICLFIFLQSQFCSLLSLMLLEEVPWELSLVSRIGCTPKGAYSSRRCSRHLLETLLRTLLSVLSTSGGELVAQGVLE